MDGTDGAIFGSTMEDILAEVASKEGIALGKVGLGEQSAYGTRRLEERVEERERAGFYERYPNLGEYWEHQRRLGSVATIGNSIDTTLGTMRISNMTQRMLPSGSSALDVSIVITGDYRPPPYLDLNVIAEDSINRQGEKVVSTLRERGSRAGRQFFDRVDGIEAVAKAVATPRPTRTPTGTPTRKPSGPPTATPSEQPSLAPSGESFI